VQDAKTCGYIAGEVTRERETQRRAEQKNEGGGLTTNLVHLVKRAQKGNSEAFSKLYSIYYDRVFHAANKILRDEFDAEEVIQESFLYLFTKFDTLHEPEHFENWLFSIVYCQSLCRLRKTKASMVTASLDVSEEDDGEMPETIYTGFLPQKSLEVKEDYDLLLHMVSKLTEIQRTTFILHHFFQLSAHEISEMLDISVATTHKRLHDARSSLKASFDHAARITDYQVRKGGTSKVPYSTGNKKSYGLNVTAGH